MISRARTLGASLAALSVLTAGANAQIEVQQLDALDPLEVGLSGGALDNDLWRGSDAALITTLFARLPGSDSEGYADPMHARLAAAILLSGGEPPRGGRGDGDLALLRADRLLAAIGADGVSELLGRTPGLGRNDALSRLHAETAFARGASDEACRTADSLLEGREAAYWLRVRAYCLHLAGQGAAADINADLARSIAPDADFDSVLFSLSLGDALPDSAAPARNGLMFAMMSEALAAPAPVDETAPAWLRDYAGELATEAVIGSQSPGEDLIAAQDLDGEERLHALEAVLGQGLDRERAAAALALILNDARASSEADFLRAARRYGGEVDTLPVTQDTIGYGVDFVVAAVFAGDVRAAMRWRDALLSGPPRRPVVAPPVVAPPVPGQAPGAGEGGEEPLGFEPPKPSISEPEDEAMPEWVPPAPRLMVTLDLLIALARNDLDGPGSGVLTAALFESDENRTSLDMAGLIALGAPAPQGWRAAWLDQEPAMASPLIAAMEAALRENARGEAGLLGLLALKEGGETLSADSFARILYGLDAAGLREEALILVMEIMARRTS